MKFGSLVGKKALQKGLVLRFDPHWIAFAPPLIISEEETDKMMDIFEESLRETLASVN
jgi:adenosylmethionine-8-amino-7-oxononanoate aminotransferase